MALKRKTRGKGKRLSALEVKLVKSKSPNEQPLYEIELVYEYKMQIDIINETHFIKYKNGYVFDYIHHTPNGGNRSKSEGARFKKMGVKAGYPDLSIDIVTKEFAGLRIELKRGSKGEISDDQKDMLNLLNEEGYYAVICSSVLEATDTIRRYITGEIKKGNPARIS